MVVEVMGRYAGWIALYAGVGGGADVILIPEIPYDLEAGRAADPGSRRLGRALLASSSSPKAQSPWAARRRSSRPRSLGRAERLGGVGHRIAAELEEMTGKETRTVVLGHLQRGGSPTASIASSPRASAAKPWSC